jgi:hypothetical protein
MVARCQLRKTMSGKYRFRSGKGGKMKCSPSAASVRRHVKLFGKSGGKAHKEHAMELHKRRLGFLTNARLAKAYKRQNRM